MKALGGKKALLLALVLGLLAALASYQYIKQRALQSPSGVEMATVVVAAQDIQARSRLTETTLRLEDVPLSARHPDAVTSLEDAEGRITRFPITAGEQVLFNKFITERAESGLSFFIPPNKRAVAVKVSEVVGSGGLIIPGNHVDIIAVFDAKTMGKDMAALLLQDIEVLAVAQTIQGEGEDQAADSKGSAGSGGASIKNDGGSVSKSKVYPTAKSITVAVDPEQAQRLVLAEERGQLRMALRPNKESSYVDLVEATLGNIRAPLKQGQAQITGVSISPTTLKAGDTMKVEITVKNVSDRYIKSQGPDKAFTYVQGQTFHSQAFPSQAGAYRVGINFAGQSAIDFPYRWGLGADIAPGSSTTVVGYVKFTSDFRATNYWAGLILEPSEIVQDNVGNALVTVAAATSAVVSVDVASVRSSPSIGSSIIEDVPMGTELALLGQESGWYRVKVPQSGRQGFVAAGWITVPQ